MLAVVSLKRSLQFDPVEQGVKRKRAELKLPASTYTVTTPPLSPPPSIFTSTSFEKKPTSKSSSLTNLSNATDDIPMFSFAQAAQMCVRRLREQEKVIREQYDQLLASKLNEQYEQFVTYSHDSVHRNSSQAQRPRLFQFGQEDDVDKLSTVTSFSYIS